MPQSKIKLSTVKVLNRTTQKNFSTQLYKSIQLHTRGKLPRFVTNNKVELFTGQSHLTTRRVTPQIRRDQTINLHDNATDDTRFIILELGRDVHAPWELERDCARRDANKPVLSSTKAFTVSGAGTMGNASARAPVSYTPFSF